jgi:prepilin-type N-terminal cleavage/methylation domain-containing protein
MHKHNSMRGFTIVETIIVILIISILALITVQTYQGVQRSAKSAVVADALKKIEKSLRINATLDGIDQWWDDEYWTSYDGHPPINVVIAETGFREYFQQLPELAGLSSDDWTYDNDLDTYNGCTADSDGVNIYIYRYNDRLSAQQIDDRLDDGDLNCGKLRYDSDDRLLWSIDRDRHINN